jgi:troponin T
MSDEEDERSNEPEPTEAELALKKRREAQRQESHGLDDAARELLQTNKEDRQRMEEEINELRQRNERRKKEREVEEKRLAAERAAEEERRKAVEEEKRRKKEEEDQKRIKDRASKTAEFDKLNKNANKPNFVISKRTDSSGAEVEEGVTGGVQRKSKEQLEAEKKAILNQRIVPLNIDGFDASKLAEKAKELHKLIHRLEGEKYDHEKRFKAQQVDMLELAERARQANKVGRGGLKRVQVSSDDVDEVQSRFSGAPAKIEMYSKYERQKDKRPYVERKTLYTGPLFGHPADRIKPKKIVKWSEEGLPQYEELAEEAAAPEPAAAAAQEE